jgi:hypothetical protein
MPPGTATTTPSNNTRTLLDDVDEQGAGLATAELGVSMVPFRAPNTICSTELDCQLHSAPMPRFRLSNTPTHGTLPGLPRSVELLAPSNETKMLYPLADMVADKILGGNRRGAMATVVNGRNVDATARDTMPPFNVTV